MRLVNDNCKAQMNWELLSGNDSEIIIILYYEINFVQNMPLICKLFKENECFYTKAVKTDNDHACVIAQFNLKMHVLQQHYRSFNLKFKNYRRQFSRIQIN